MHNMFNRLSRQFRRHLNLHEYQSKQLMNSFGLNTQRFKIIEAAEDVDQATRELSKKIVELLILIFLDADEIVIKAQILAGGRGKGTFTSGLKGGVQLTRQ